ncbi:MAG: tetratricopeptide repeat protein [Chitinispirillaceae bacterium]
MRKIVFAVFAVSLLVSFSGCSHMTVLRTRELRAVQSKVDTLNTEMTALQKKLLEEQNTNSEILRLLRADQQVRFNQLERKVVAIENNLSESQSRLSLIDKKTTEFTKRLERKLADEEAAKEQKKLEIKKLFEIAMSDFNAGRYDMAINGFQDIVNQYPESPQAPESEYWIAESHYAKKDYETAERAYVKFVKKHPESEKFCVCLYKLGLAYDKQDKVKSKKMVWKNLLKRCEDSKVAQVVKAEMEKEETQTEDN